MKSLASLSLLIAMLWFPGPFVAQDRADTWPPPPSSDESDWIELTSGEWLKGEVIAMYDSSLEFDSDKLNRIKLDWDDIRQIRTARTMQVAFLDDVVATGKLLVNDGEARVIGDQEYRYPRSEILSMTAGVPKERNYWSGRLGAGLNLRSGNTEQTEYNARAHLMRRTPKNRMSLDYLGIYSESDDTTLADSQRVSSSWNHFISKGFYVTPVYGEFYRDRFHNIAGRWTLGTGVGYQIVDTSKVTWSVDGGVAYQRTEYSDPLDDEADSADAPALTVRTRYENDMTEWADYFLDYNFFVVDEGSGTYSHNLQTGFGFDLFGDFDFDVSVVWDRVQDPQRNADGTIPDRDDFRTILALGYSF